MLPTSAGFPPASADAADFRRVPDGFPPMLPTSAGFPPASADAADRRVPPPSRRLPAEADDLLQNSSRSRATAGNTADL